MSILRPEKRDPNLIRNKSDIGLSKVDNISSAEFTSIVLDQVKRYINRETIYQAFGRKYIALAKISCKDDGSGNITKILSGNLFITFAVLNESEDVCEVVKLETIYSHNINGTEIDYEDDSVNLEYSIFMTENPTLLNECYLEFRENKYEDTTGTVVTELYAILRCDSQNLPFVSINLFEYSNGGVALDPSTLSDNLLSSYQLVKTAKLDHSRYSLVDKSEATVGFEIYDENWEPVRVKDNESISNPIELNSSYKVPTINGIAFTGRRNIQWKGESTRDIVVPAKHKGPSREEAGAHDWGVIPYVPRAGYKYLDENNIIKNNIYPDTSFLDRDNFETPSNNQAIPDIYSINGYGLTRLASVGNNNLDGITLPNKMIDSKQSLLNNLKDLYEWSDSLSKVGSDVISVQVFKTYIDSITNLLWKNLKHTIDLYEIISQIPGTGLEDKNKITDFLNNNDISKENGLGYHYIFDYAQTSDSITRIDHTGSLLGNSTKKSVTYSIKTGVIGEGSGDFINATELECIACGGVEKFVRARIGEQDIDGNIEITFTFISANDDNKSREGYYIINSGKDDINGSKIKLVYRFYQDVEESNLRISFEDETGLPQLCTIGSKYIRTINNESKKISLKGIKIVNLDDPDLIPLNNGTISYDLNGGSISIVDSETGYNEATKTFDITLSLSENLSSSTRISSLQINNEERGEKKETILFVEIRQESQKAKITARTDTDILKKNSTCNLMINSNKRWEMSIINGSNKIEILPDFEDGGSELISGNIPNGEEFYTFKRTIRSKVDCFSLRGENIATVKIFPADEGKDSVSAITVNIRQIGLPAEIQPASLSEIIIPSDSEEKTELTDFRCTYDWIIEMDSDLQDWCTIEPLQGEATDFSTEKYTPITFKTKKTSDTPSIKERGTFTIHYANRKYKTDPIVVKQRGEGFEFSTNLSTNNGLISLGSKKESFENIIIYSNYDGWEVKPIYEDPENPKFDVKLDNTDQLNIGANGSNIQVIAKESNLSATKTENLGRIQIFCKGEPVSIKTETGYIISEFIIVQKESGISIELLPNIVDSNYYWYPDGVRIETEDTSDITIPVSFAPTSGTISVTIDGVKVEPDNASEEGKRYIKVPSPGRNTKKDSRDVKVVATISYNSEEKESSFTLKQKGCTKGISINGKGYYGETIKEDTITFNPIVEEITLPKKYKALPAEEELVVTSCPSWINISKNSSGECKLATKSVNIGSKRGPENVILTSGSGHDKTEVIFEVIQKGSTWKFGIKTEDGSIDENDYSTQAYIISKTLDSSAALAYDKVVEIASYYDDGNTYNSVEIEVSVVEGNDWCEVKKGDPVSGIFPIYVRTLSSNNTGSDRDAKIKITQNENVIYLIVTQKRIEATLKINGGLSDTVGNKIDTYILSDSPNLGNFNLTSYIEDIKNNATIFKGGDSYQDLGEVKYVRTSNGNISVHPIKELNIGNKLYLNRININTNSIDNKFTLKDDFTEQVNFIIDGRSKTINIQRFGTKFITIDPILIKPESDYILTSEGINCNWNIKRMDTTSGGNYYFFSTSDESFDPKFSINPQEGVVYLTDTEVTETSNKEKHLYMFIKDSNDDRITEWLLYGQIIWNPNSDSNIIS